MARSKTATNTTAEHLPGPLAKIAFWITTATIAGIVFYFCQGYIETITGILPEFVARYSLSIAAGMSAALAMPSAVVVVWVGRRIAGYGLAAAIGAGVGGSM